MLVKILGVWVVLSQVTHLEQIPRKEECLINFSGGQFIPVNYTCDVTAEEINKALRKQTHD